MARRAQANVVGIVLLVGITALALGTLTASVGTVVDDHAERVAVTRTSDELGGVLRPARTVGGRSGRVTLDGGHLSTVDREVRVLNASGVVAERRGEALVYRRGPRRVVAVGGALVRDGPGGARFARRPHLVTAAAGTLLVSASAVTGRVDVGGTGAVTVDLRTQVAHERTRLGNDTYRVAVETSTPGPWRRYLSERGATVAVRDVDGDGVPSVVATFAGTREGHLLTHRVTLESAVVG